ncbi:hypothetical protein B0H65DRAFT_546861 [Neurospora tetraspora]|uniref:Uncharacterized protein n=1 Tax=Neurospora tetraspora TaxID=94610 RepID=A0AAE0MUV1_9PEZI|nr:hypothetical protein B0H65DRAFT_546861 [Neurospora tetraspora]
MESRSQKKKRVVALTAISASVAADARSDAVAIWAKANPVRTVSSHNIPLKPDTTSTIGYSVNDARHANGTIIPYGQHLGAVGVSDHRSYPYGHHQAPPPTSHKQDFPATATYASAPNPYGDLTAVGVGSQFADYTAAGHPPVHAMAHEIVGMVPSWSSRKTTPYGGSPSFSFSGTASLPTTSTGADRLLPNPTARTGTSRSSLPYAGGTAMKTSFQPGVSSPPANVAASATAYGGFDGLPASYGSIREVEGENCEGAKASGGGGC